MKITAKSTIGFILLLCLTGVINVFAQGPIQGTSNAAGNRSGGGDIMLGVKGGINISGLYGELDDKMLRGGIHMGMAVELPIAGDFYLQPEVLISLQGAGIDDSDAIKLNYLNLPIMAKYYIIDELAIELGPYAGFLLGSNSDSFTNIEPNGVDIGIGSGVGFRLNDNLYFNTRYSIGLLETLDNFEVGNTLFQLSTTYFF